MAISPMVISREPTPSYLPKDASWPPKAKRRGRLQRRWGYLNRWLQKSLLITNGTVPNVINPPRNPKRRSGRVIVNNINDIPDLFNNIQEVGENL